MTCASCATRIEKKLNRMDGVVATVNYATEKAHVTYADAVRPDDLLATVAKTGYTASVPPPPTSAPDDDNGAASEADRDPVIESLRQRVVITAALTIPVVLLSMIPALQFEFWQWAALTLAAPVVTWGAWPFHRAALISAAARRLHDGHARLARCRGRLRLVAVRVVPRRCRRARHDDAVHPRAGPRLGRRRDLPRGRDRRHPVPAARPLPGGARPPAVRQRTARPAVDGRQGRRRAARRARGPAAGGRAAGGRRVRRTTGGEGRDRRRGRPGHLRRRRVDADGRAGAGRGRAGRRRRRRDGELRRPHRRPRHPGRRVDPARADGPTGRAGAERQGRRAAAGRPGVRRLRAGRHRAGGRDAGLLARHRREP